MFAKENAKRATCLLRDFNISMPQKTQDSICTYKHATNTHEYIYINRRNVLAESEES